MEHYREFTRKRIHEEQVRESEENYIYYEDQLFLPKEYAAVYNDTLEELECKETIAQSVCEQIVEIRAYFQDMNAFFDFHQCFYFEDREGYSRFKLHQKYEMAQDYKEGEVPKLNYPLILLSAINGNGFIGCFCEVFKVSKRFSKIRVLNLRGCDERIVSKRKLKGILEACDQIAHLNLNFMKEAVDQEILFLIAEKFRGTLISLEVR